MLDPQDLPELLTTRQAAALLGVHPEMLRHWVSEGKLAARRMTPRGARHYAKQDVLRLMQLHDDRVRDAQRVVVEVARAISSSLDLNAVARTVVDAAVRVVGSDRCAIYLVSDDRATVMPLWGTDVNDPGSAQRLFYPNPIPIDVLPLLRYALDHPEPTVIDDTETHPLSNPELFRFFETRTVINVGLRGADGDVFGFMPFVWTGKPHPVRDDDVFFAQSLAALAEVALSNARLFAQIEQERARATIINAVAHDVHSGRDLGDTLARAIGSMVKQLHGDEGAIWLTNPQGTAIIGAVETSASAPSRIGAAIELAPSTHIAQVVALQRPLLISQAEVAGVELAWFQALGVQASLYVPLLTQGRLVGIAFVNYCHQTPVLHASDELFAAALAAQCTLAIERVQLLESASTRAAELEAIFDAMSDSVLIIDQAGRTLNANAAAVQLWGSLIHELPLAERIVRLNMRFADGTPLQPDTSPTGRALRGHSVANVEIVETLPGGGDHTLSVSSGPIFDAHGQVRAAVTVARDITEMVASRREKLELAEQFRRKAAEFEAVIAQMGEGVIITNRDGHITLVNEYAAGLHGTAILDVPPASYSQEYHLLRLDGSPYPPLELPLARAALHGETVINAEWRVRRADNSEVIASGSATPILGPDGTRLGAVLVVRDVTERRKLEAEKDQFLSVVSHELKTPLTTIKGLTELVMCRINRGLDPTAVLESLGNVAKQVRRMEGLIGDLLEIRQFEQGALPLSCQTLDARLLVAEARERAQALTDRHSIEAQLETPQPLLVSVDKGRFEQVLDNLLANAIKYSPNGGTIVLALSQHDKHAVLRVSDPGIGIPEQGREQLFERFYRGPNVRASEYGGLGIGLALSREIIERHGGTLLLEATSSHGTTFQLRLPLV